MKLPDRCPNCNSNFGSYQPNESIDEIHACLVNRGELDWDMDEPHRIEDSIMECSQCHALFRFRWKLESVTMLVEKQISPVTAELASDGGKQ